VRENAKRREGARTNGAEVRDARARVRERERERERGSEKERTASIEVSNAPDNPDIDS